jgi:hypothetical protein
MSTGCGVSRTMGCYQLKGCVCLCVCPHHLKRAACSTPTGIAENLGLLVLCSSLGLLQLRLHGRNRGCTGRTSELVDHLVISAVRLNLRSFAQCSHSLGGQGSPNIVRFSGKATAPANL